jgi:BspA type Leucine rich repeat region (6 copies)
MNTQSFFATTTRPNTMASRLRTACAAILLPLLFFALPAVVQAQFTYTTNNGTITITKYTGSDSVVVIPSTTNGFPVTSIGSYAFPGGTRLSSVTIPNSVLNIERFAFSCGSLPNVTIPDSVTNIGDYAFYSSALTNVTIGNSVTSIGVGAFYYCDDLSNVTIPNSVISIGVRAFECFRLTAIMMGASNPAYSSVDGVLFDRSTNTLIQCPGDKAGAYTIPDSVTNIERCACRNSMRMSP